jgi:RNA recognition motif-containing protein
MMHYRVVVVKTKGIYMHNENYSEPNQDYLSTRIGNFNKDISVSTIYVGNLSYDMVEFDILDMFEEYGHVNYVKLIKDKETHESRGIAFVQMSRANEARDAISTLNGRSIEGRSLKVSIAKEEDNTRVAVKAVKERRKPYKGYVSKAKRAVIAQ